MSWIFTVDDTVFESEKQKDGSIKLKCTCDNIQYETLINNFEKYLNPQCPADIKTNWSNCLLWDLLAEGEPSKDKLNAFKKDDEVVLEIKRAYGRFFIKLGEISLKKTQETTAKASATDTTDKKLIEQLHQQRIQLHGQNQIIEDLKSQLNEITERHAKDRDELINKMVALLNTKKRKIHQLMTGRNSPKLDAKDSELPSSPKVKQELSTQIKQDPDSNRGDVTRETSHDLAVNNNEDETRDETMNE